MPTHSSSRPAGRIRVLIIDDDEIALQSIKDLLEAAGYEAHTMVSPIGATQVIVAQQIQAVVVDLNMPVMRGDRFIALLKGWDRIRDLPTVLISGSPMSTLAAIADQLPGTQVVTKDNLRTGLPEALGRALTRRGERTKR